MERIAVTPRSDWQQRCESVGFNFHSQDDAPYWDESACYRFTSQEIRHLAEVTGQLNQLCLEAVEEVIRRDWFEQLAVEPSWIPRIISSWEKQEPSLFGRFDLHFDGHAPAKLLEIKPDSPAMLLETSVVQWFWLQDCRPHSGQCNSIHEMLVQRWREIWSEKSMPLHLACSGDWEEDLGNLSYLCETAMLAGLDARQMEMEDIGWDWLRSCFVDLEDQVIRALMKLYPWQRIVKEGFGPLMVDHPMRLLEPPWKMLLSSNAILPVLWRLFPDHPHLLAAWQQPVEEGLVKKSIRARDDGGRFCLSLAEEEGFVYQRNLPLPSFDGHQGVVGSWVVGNQPAGIGVWEAVPDQARRFVPHYIL